MYMYVCIAPLNDARCDQTTLHLFTFTRLKPTLHVMCAIEGLRVCSQVQCDRPKGVLGILRLSLLKSKFDVGLAVTKRSRPFA